MEKVKPWRELALSFVAFFSITFICWVITAFQLSDCRDQLKEANIKQEKLSMEIEYWKSGHEVLIKAMTIQTDVMRRMIK